MRAVRLNNGLQVWIRPILPSDAWRLQDGLKQLSRETIRRRFLSNKTRFTSTELRYLTEVDGVNHIALVALSSPPGGGPSALEPSASAMSAATGRLVAVARCVRDPEQPDMAEWAIVVGDELQGQGLGTILIRALVDEARKVGISWFSATIAGENKAVARLLAHVTDRFESDRYDHGVREVVVGLAA